VASAMQPPSAAVRIRSTVLRNLTDS